MKKLAFFFIAALFCIPALAQTPPAFVGLNTSSSDLTGSYVSCYTSNGTGVPGTWSCPLAGGTKVDGISGATIRRPPDPTDCYQGCTTNPSTTLAYFGMVVDYSKWSPSSRDGAYFLFGQGIYYQLYSVTGSGSSLSMTYVRRIQIDSTTNAHATNGTDMSSDNSNRVWETDGSGHLLYYTGLASDTAPGRAVLKAYDPDTDSSSVIHDFTSLINANLPGCVNVDSGSEGRPSDDDRYWAFDCTDNANTDYGIVFYDKQLNTATTIKYGAGGLCGVSACTGPSTMLANWVGVCASSVNASTPYIVVNWNQGTNNPPSLTNDMGVTVYNTSFTWLGWADANDGHGDCGPSSDGKELYVTIPAQNANNWQANGIAITDLSNLSTTTPASWAWAPGERVFGLPCTYNFPTGCATSPLRGQQYTISMVGAHGAQQGTMVLSNFSAPSSVAGFGGFGANANILIPINYSTAYTSVGAPNTIPSSSQWYWLDQTHAIHAESQGGGDEGDYSSQANGVCNWDCTVVFHTTTGEIDNGGIGAIPPYTNSNTTNAELPTGQFRHQVAAVALPLGTPPLQPQPTYAQTMTLRHPATWLRFNGISATSFSDNITGLNYGTSVTQGFTPISPSSTTDQVHIITTPLPAGALTQVQIYYPLAPVAGTQTFVTIGNMASPGSCGAALCYNQTAIFSVTPTAATGWQVFNAGTDYSPINVSASTFLGVWQSSSHANGPGQANDSQTNSYYLATTSTPTNSNYLVNSAAGWTVGLKATVATSGTITPRQPGFDLTQKNNYSVAIPYNGWIAAPNNTAGDYEWTSPQSIYVHIDNLSVDRVPGATIVLASKGDWQNGNGWAMTAEADAAHSTPLSYRFCFHQHSTVGVNPPGTINQYVCTGPGTNLAADGAGYDLLFVDNGTGWMADNALYVNGANGGGGASSPEYFSNFGNGLGALNITFSGGTGYPSNTDIIATGGGPHCVVHLSMVSVGGVPNGSLGPPSTGSEQNSGCTSSPTCTLAASSGSGATVTCNAETSTISTATVSPLYIGGTSTDASQPAILVDEYAQFSNALSQTDAVNFFYQTNWYQQIAGAAPAKPPLVIFEDDGASDLDNEYAFAAAIGMDLHGYIRLVGVINNDPAGSCPSMWRQMLDQAGLNQIPIATSYTFSAGGTGCNLTNIQTYNASTPTASSAYLNSTTLYRTLLAKYSTTPIQIFSAGDYSGLAALMQSPADSISPLTGIQLLNQNTTNGGGMWLQGLVYCSPTSPPVATSCSGSATGPTEAIQTNLQYLVTHNGTNPIYWVAGTPSETGQDLPYSRTSKDPMFLFSAAGPRFGWDTLALVSIITNKFTSGVNVTFSGGTGYATWTPVTQTGGGTNCPAQLGWLHSTSGVPDYAAFEGGTSILTTSFSQYLGMAGGCTSLPTVSATGTGTGVTLTPSLNGLCGTITVTIGSPNSTIAVASGTCSNVFFMNMNAVAVASNESPWFLWFANALMDNPPQGQPRQPQ